MPHSHVCSSESVQIGQMCHGQHITWTPRGQGLLTRGGREFSTELEKQNHGQQIETGIRKHEESI